MLHSGGASLEFWSKNLAALAQFHRIYAVDMVGSGYSDKPEASCSLTYQAQFVKDFMDTLSIERASLIGNSIGGGVALQVAIMFPERVEKLVLANSFGLGKHIGIFPRLASLPLLDRFPRPSRSLIALILKPAVYDPEAITDELLELIYQLYGLPRALNALCRLVRTNLNLFGVRNEVFSSIVNQLFTITAPTFVTWGQQDRVLPVAHAHIAVRELPNARLHIFERCGHFPQLEHPEEFNALALEFLAN